MITKEIKILLVDDEEEILFFLSYVLRKDGFKVFTSNNGKEAIKIATTKIPDVIILDVMMPGMDGFEVCEKLRSIKRLENSLITFLSAKSDDISKIAGLNLGADDYIVKPIKPKLFVSKIHSLLRRRKPFLPEKSKGNLKINDLKINLDNIKVKKMNEKVDLTKVEYQLLLIFAQEPDKTFTREEIYKLIWGTEILVGDRTLDVHVRNLRKKIGKENIRTYKGIGYSFNLQ